MKNWRKVIALMLVLAMAFSMVACGGEAGSSSSETSTPESTVEPTSEDESSEEGVEPEPTGDELATPREETLYFGGIQWGKPGSNNPMSPNPNFSLIDQSDMARVAEWETLYMFNLLDGKAYPLLADGDFEWNADKTVITVKMNPAAKWSDGTALTAHDVAATFDAHVKYESNLGADYSTYIESIVATDDATVEITAVTGDNYNPLKLEEYLPKVYVMQKAYLEAKDAEHGGDPIEMKNDTWWDAPHSGPYTPVLFDSISKWVAQRNDNYWGQDASLFGGLPAPKYLAHNIFADNASTAVGFQNAEVDVNQQYLPNIQDMWEKEGHPISTYLDDAPYHISAGIPSAFFNMNREGLDQVEIRKAIAMATDFDQINSASMTGQSPKYSDVPRSLFNPTVGERSLIRDPEALKEYQFMGKDIEGANKLLDDAGIVDTNGDGVREYNGKELSFKVQCPTGWSDWNSALEVVAAAGKEIGITLETYFTETATWTEDLQGGNFDIIMNGPAAASIANPWTRTYQLMYGFGGEFAERQTSNWGRYYDARVDELINLIPVETDEAKLLEYYEELNIKYLTDVPSFGLMYRPAYFHAVNETVWTGFPVADDGSNIPPQICINGYGIAALYNIHLVNG